VKRPDHVSQPAADVLVPEESLKGDLATLQSDWSSYQAAQTALPTYVSSSAVTSAQEQVAVTQAPQAESQFSADEAQATSGGRALVAQANQIAASAMTAANRATSGGC